MRKAIAIAVVAVLVVAAVPSFAELQNVQVGGSLKIRGNYFDYDDVAGAHVNSLAFVEQRSRLNVKADFTDAVSAFIELDSYDVWGEDFRSNYLTGVDSRANTTDDVSLYQAYIEANEMFGTGLKARIGRQELVLGSGWLVGNKDSQAFFYGLSFDALRLTYATDLFSVDAFWAKLAENSPVQEDGDIDLYGVYGSYTGIENVSLDAYWLFVRDAANVAGSLDTHTFGLRGAGTLGAFDFEAEAAYQLIDLDDADNSDALAGNLVVGYTFDTTYSPRVYLGGAYFEGSDDDLAFNRLFSNWKYSLFLDNNNDLSNIWLAHGGVSINPTESLKLTASVGYVQALQSRDLGCGKDSDKPLAYEAGIRADYAYTKDLSLAVGYSHLFVQDGLEDGSVAPHNGSSVAFADDANYVFFETKLSF